MKPRTLAGWAVVVGFAAGLLAGAWIRGRQPLRPPPPGPATAPAPADSTAHRSPLFAEPQPAIVPPRGPLTLDAAIALLAQIAGDPAASSRLRAAALLADAVQAADLTRVLTLVEALPDPELRAFLRHRLLARWGETAPREAWAFARTLPLGPQRDEAMTAALQAPVREDFNGLVRWMEELDDASRRAEVLSSLIPWLPTVDPSRAWDFVRRLPAGPDRSNALRSVVGSWARTNLDLALGKLAGLGEPPDRAAALEALFDPWLERSPPDAASAVQALAPGETRDTLLNQAADSWGQRDPEAAFRWMVQHADGERRPDLLFRVLLPWVARDPRGALSAVANLPPGDERQGCLAVGAGEWALRDPRSAVAWAASLGDADRARVQLNLAARWAVHAPADAAQFVTTLPAGDLQLDAAAAVLSQWASRDPATAARWASLLTEGELRTEAVTTVARLWSGSDPGGAERWLGGLPADVSRDAAIGAFCDQLSRSSPERAARWVLNINDEPRRLRHVQILAARWLERNQAEARRWIEGLPLPAGDIEMLLGGGQ